MADSKYVDVILDNRTIDVSKEVGLVLSIANSLRGAYTSDKYKDVIIPMTIIRRFECALEETKDKVIAQVEADEKSGKITPDLISITYKNIKSHLRVYLRGSEPCSCPTY